MATEVSLSPLQYPLCGKYRKPDIRSMFSNPVPLSARITLSRFYDLTSEVVYFLGIPDYYYYFYYYYCHYY